MPYTEINSERQFKDVTGHGKSDFFKLLKDFENTFLEEYGRTYEEYLEEEVFTPPKIRTLGEGLFFVLYQLKNGLIWGSLGFTFGMAGSSAQDNYNKFFDLLELTLKKKKSCPKENLKALKNSKNIRRTLTK